MLTTSELQFLDEATAEATRVGAPFPEMEASEAALESRFGQSELAREGNNFFGMKQHVHPEYVTLNLPTHEGTPGLPDWKEITAEFIKYPDWGSCFTDRINTLIRLSPIYPHYKAALTAKDAETFITQVSMTWSTDTTRAMHVSQIYQDYIASKETA
jgi:flagellum-specific peptidoglycan hydrolase FlgJ